jgi:hypothetical protein
MSQVETMFEFLPELFDYIIKMCAAAFELLLTPWFLAYSPWVYGWPTA